jgi:D-beta-D-heptose 7-phosphate kinase / D-beta-D-heptose 1-phosphate adenosyltransferase
MTIFGTAESQKCRVLVAGDVMVDRYVFGEANRISPEAPVPVVLGKSMQMRPGGAANVAANIAALGGSCKLLSVVGDDAARLDLISLMEKHDVHYDMIVEEGHRTTEKLRVLVGTQQIVRVDHEDRVPEEALGRFHESFMDHIGKFDLVVFSDYGKGVLRRLPELLAIARRAGVRTLVDPKVTDPEHYRGAYLLKPNAAEFRALFPEAEDHNLVNMARAALRKYQIEHLLITRGGKGMLLISANGDVVERQTRAREVFDVSGAGDTVIATLAVGLGSGLTLARAMDLSNIAASIAVAHTGTYVVTVRDMEQKMLTRAQGLPKVMSLQALVERVRTERGRGASVVFTNGCFDLIHPGHVRLLAAARAEGDLLIVGLNSDESVRRLKGPTRPVNTFQDRAEVLAALSSVDLVVEFYEDTPYELIKAVQPDVLVKGGDYTVEQIVGHDIVLERSGRVISCDFHAGYSTTSILTRRTEGPGQ